MQVELSFVAGLVVLLILAIPLRVNAFFSLLVAAAIIGLGSGLGLVATVQVIVNGFGKTVGSIGIIIIFGVVLGQYLEDSGGAKALAQAAVRLVGHKRSPLAMALSGYVVSIPVFSDVGYVILCPLAKAIAQSSRVAFPVIAVALASGLLATHVFVPPTPGPIAVAGLLGIDVGRMILWGGFAAGMMTAGGWAWAQFVLPLYLPAGAESRDGPIGKPEGVGPGGASEANSTPGLLASALPLLLPLLLIVGATTSAMVFPEGNRIREIAAGIGNANVALFFGAFAALVLLRKHLLAGGRPVLGTLEGALKSAGPIIFITAAGGGLGAVLESSGAGKAVAAAIAGSGLPFILVPFAISGLLKTVQGSGTVAVITAATLCRPIAQQLGLDPILIALAAGSGARLVCHVNDSFFWVFASMNGFDTKTSLKTLSMANLAMAGSGLLATWLVSRWI